MDPGESQGGSVCGGLLVRCELGILFSFPSHGILEMSSQHGWGFQSHGKDLHAWLSQEVFPAARVLLYFSSKSNNCLVFLLCMLGPGAIHLLNFSRYFASNSFIFGNDTWWNLVHGAVIFMSGRFQV